MVALHSKGFFEGAMSLPSVYGVGLLPSSVVQQFKGGNMFQYYPRVVAFLSVAMADTWDVTDVVQRCLLQGQH